MIKDYQVGRQVTAGFLYQCGAPHSRDPRKTKSKQKRREEADRFTWLYRNSLFLAFVLLFVFSLTLHIVFGANAYNEERALIGQPPISIAAFLLSAKFWSSTLQTWQVESRDRTLCRAQYLSASAGPGGIEAGRIEERNNRRGGQVNDMPPAKALLVMPDHHVAYDAPQRKAVAVPAGKPGRHHDVSVAGHSPGELVGERRGRESQARSHWTVAGTAGGVGRHNPAVTKRLNTVRKEI
jgi:hypothetical protein